MKMIGTLLACGAGIAVAFAAERPKDSQFRSTFPVDKAKLVASGANRYFPLHPGFRAVFAHGNATLVRTVLGETKIVDGVETRVVEEREDRAGAVIEIARDYYAIDPLTSDVYYFGEDVDDYKDGKVVGHGGAWLSGVAGATFGLVMPGQAKYSRSEIRRRTENVDAPRPQGARPRRIGRRYAAGSATPRARMQRRSNAGVFPNGSTKVGDRFVNGLAPGKAMDRSEIAAVDETITTPAGTFTGCLHVKDTTPLEPRLVEDKWYAPGVGAIKDAEFTLVKIERPAQ